MQKGNHRNEELGDVLLRVPQQSKAPACLVTELNS
jgi:hypothetical protein